MCMLTYSFVDIEFWGFPINEDFHFYISKEKPGPRRLREAAQNMGREEGHKVDGGTCGGINPKGRQGPGWRTRAATGGANDAGYDGRCRHAARGAERAEEAGGGGCGRLPRGWSSWPGKDMGIGCNWEVLQKWPLLMGGGRRREIKRSRKRLRKVGRGDIIKVVIIKLAESKDWEVTDWGLEHHHLIIQLYWFVLETGLHTHLKIFR